MRRTMAQNAAEQKAESEFAARAVPSAVKAVGYFPADSAAEADRPSLEQEEAFQ